MNPNLPERAQPAALRTLSEDKTKALCEALLRERSEPWQHDPTIPFLADLFSRLSELELTLHSSGIADWDGAWLPGNSWLLFALKPKWLPQQTFQGAVGFLRIDLIENGCGMFYPDPLSAGHLAIAPDFQTALRDAWELCLGQNTAGRNFDYRWSLSFIDTSIELQYADKVWEHYETKRYPKALEYSRHQIRSNGCFLPLIGESGGLSIAAGLLSAMEKEPLDSCCLATAQLVRPLPGVIADWGLKCIDGLDQKLAAIKAQKSVSAITQAWDTLIVREKQTVNQPQVNATELKRVPNIKTFKDAFGHLSRFGRMTQAMKLVQRDLACDFLKRECFGSDQDPLACYMDSPYYWEVPTPQRTKTDEREEVLIGPGDEALKALYSGRFHERPFTHKDARLKQRPSTGNLPLRLVADSGFGKSTLLWRMMYEIAVDPQPRVPILLTELDEYLNATNKTQFQKDVCDLLLPVGENFDNYVTREGKSILSKDTNQFLTKLKDAEVDWAEWLNKQHERGRIVWLADAVDQATLKTTTFSKILAQHMQSPWVITMRPTEVPLTNKVYKYGWDTLRIGGIDEQIARDYLSEEWADFFFELLPPPEGQLNSEGEKKSEQEPSVLQIPMILKLLRDFTRGKIVADVEKNQELKNRGSVYHMVIAGQGGLIERGVASLKQSYDSPDNIPAWCEEHEVIDILSELALWQMEKGWYENVLTKSQSIEFLKEYFRLQGISIRGPNAPEYKKAIVQINLLTANSITEQSEIIAWRHRSFVEWFAGYALAKLAHSEEFSDRERVNKLLDNVLDIEAAVELNVNIPERWHWVFRYAIDHEEQHVKRAKQEKRLPSSHPSLADHLLRRGQPYVVYHAIQDDHVHLWLKGERDVALTKLCRWLVNFTWSYREHKFNKDTFRDAQGIEYEWTVQPSSLDSRTAKIVGDGFRRPYRNGPVLPAAYYLVAHSENQGPSVELTNCIEAAKDNLFQDFVGKAPAVDPHTVIAWIKTFKKCPPENWTPNPKDNPGWERIYVNGKTTYTFPYPLPYGGLEIDSKATVEPFWVSAMTIRNEQWEWFDPSHFFRREKDSIENRQPVNNISWYMCTLYAMWLSSNFKKLKICAQNNPIVASSEYPNHFSLMSTIEWEFATRAGTNEEVPRRKNGLAVDGNAGRRTWGSSDDDWEEVDRYTNDWGVVHPVCDLCNLCDDLKKGFLESFCEWFIPVRGTHYGQSKDFATSNSTGYEPDLPSNFNGFRLRGILDTTSK